jgi:riboflavin synthase
MFTALIESTGTLLPITATAGVTLITIASPKLTARLNPAAASRSTLPPRYLAAETIARTTLANLRPDSTVNFELPRPLDRPSEARSF